MPPHDHVTATLSALALAEVRAVRPDTGAQLAELVGHPSVVLGELDAVSAIDDHQVLIEVVTIAHRADSYRPR
ncbi:MAG: hypothetical protein ACRDTH_11345 [Pseudonocardiaceae bacterium]